MTVLKCGLQKSVLLKRAMTFYSTYLETCELKSHLFTTEVLKSCFSWTPLLPEMTPIPSHYSLWEVETQEKGTNKQFLLWGEGSTRHLPFVHSIFRPVEIQPVFSVLLPLQRASLPSQWLFSEGFWKEINILKYSHFSFAFKAIIIRIINYSWDS